MLILTLAHLDIALDQFFILLILFYFTYLTLVLVTWSLLFVCGCRRLICMHVKTGSSRTTSV